MTVKLLYFAWVREATGVGEEEVTLPADIETVEDVMTWLKSRGPGYESAFTRAPVIRAAIDQTHARHDAPIAGASVIAFFPPVTGG